MLEHDHITLVATVRRLYEMLQELNGWDLEAPETDKDGVPSPQSIAERLGFLSQSKHHGTSDEMEDHVHQDSNNHSASSDTCSANDEELLELNSSPPDQLLHKICPSLTEQDSKEAITRCESLSPEPLMWQSHQNFIRPDEQQCDMHSESIPDKMLLTPGLPNLSMSPLQEDVCSLPSHDFIHNELFLDSNFKFPPSTIDPAMLQNSFPGLNTYALDNGSQMLAINAKLFGPLQPNFVYCANSQEEYFLQMSNWLRNGGEDM